MYKVSIKYSRTCICVNATIIQALCIRTWDFYTIHMILKQPLSSKHECPNIICIEKTIRVTSGKLGPDVNVKYFVIILRISAP